VNSSENVLTTISVTKVSDKNGERLRVRIRVMEYLRNGNLPKDENVSRELTFNKKQYVLLDDVLYHMVTDGTLHVIPSVKVAIK